MAYSPSEVQKLTFDTDNGRINSSPSTVVLPTGQQIVFYSKFLTTGKESFSSITFVSPSFQVDVEAGSGTINGTPVTWVATNPGDITATSNMFEIVYVTVTGDLEIGSNLSMDFLQDKILLAYVSSGGSSITRIYELEKTGNYIYVRRQYWTGTEWEWNDYENLLNTGSEPFCFYNADTGYIYLSYKKDGISYTRLFNPLDELTWEYLPNIQITSGSITLKKDPENSIVVVGTASGYKSIVSVINNLYPLSAADFTFVEDQPYVYLPKIGGDYLSYLRGDITYEFFRLIGSTYILEASYTLSKNASMSFTEIYKLWTGTSGVKYVGIRVNTSLFIDDYVTSPIYYSSFDLYFYPSKIELNDDRYNTSFKDNEFFGIVSSGYVSSVVTTREYTEIRNSQFDTMDPAVISSGYVS